MFSAYWSSVGFKLSAGIRLWKITFIARYQLLVDILVHLSILVFVSFKIICCVSKQWHKHLYVEDKSQQNLKFLLGAPKKPTYIYYFPCGEWHTVNKITVSITILILIAEDYNLLTFAYFQILYTQVTKGLK